MEGLVLVKRMVTDFSLFSQPLPAVPLTRSRQFDGGRVFLILDMSTLRKEPAKEQDDLLHGWSPGEYRGTHADAIVGKSGSNDNTLRMSHHDFLFFYCRCFR